MNEAQSWIEETFQRKDCRIFFGDPRNPGRCGCGRPRSGHGPLTGEKPPGHSETWNPRQHTVAMATDAYGQIEFRGAGHGNKAMYIRLSDKTDPSDILKLMNDHWHLGLPNLVISILGGLKNFEIQPKLKRVLSKGLSKAARTTGAWILTRGTNTGVGIHVGDALNNHSVKMRGRITTIGMCSWGVLNKPENFQGRGLVTSYHSVACPISKGFKLNSHHTHFLFVDNGTVGQSGAEIILRQKLEKYISQQRLKPEERVPVVSVVIEGGPTAIRTVLTNISAHPRIPVVVFDGTGRAADILAFAQKYSDGKGSLDDSLRVQLLETIKHTFNFNQSQAETVYQDIVQCMKKKQLITVFCLGEDGLEDFDLAILSALLKAQSKANPGNKLRLALAWDRVDIAKQHVFVHGKELPESTLEQAMFDALANNQVDFVQLLIDNGVNMHKFLTVSRLEELYNAESGPPNTLGFLLYDVKKELSFSFKRNFEINEANASIVNETFKFPFNELFIWAVLTKRHQMALFLWRQDEEPLAKALIASQLYKAMAKSADLMNLENEIGEEFMVYSEKFKTLALQLLDHCYKEDDDVTLQLLTIRLDNWSGLTCLSLAAAAQHLEFMAHPCCQLLLSDLWMGGLHIRKYINLKVMLALLSPPAILLLSFKSKEQLLLMPQTFSEHIQDVEEAEKHNDDSSSSSSSSNSSLTRFNDTIDSFRQVKQTSAVTVADRSLTAMAVSAALKKERQLSMWKKFYEFYSAPITKFWAVSMSYIFFLGLYTYVVLGQITEVPTIPEAFVMSYVVTLGMDHIRELLRSEPPKLSQKIRVFYNVFSNGLLALCVAVFLVGMVLRFIPETQGWGRVIYILDVVFWYLQLFNILSVNMYLGTLVNMIGKMMRDMCYFVILLVIILMSFGIIREAVLNPERDAQWESIREVFHEPYWMIYGEVYAGKIIPSCTVNGTTGLQPCPGGWVVPIAMAIYLIVANILFVNLLIAVFNNTFNKVSAISTQLWKSQRYTLTMQYEQKSILVPPLVLLDIIYYSIKFLCCRCVRAVTSDRGLKLFLADDDIERLRDFEEACLELYFREESATLQASSEERIRVMANGVEDTCYRLQEIAEKENHTRMNLMTFDRRLMKLETITYTMAMSLQGIHEILLRSIADSGSRDSLAEAEMAQHPRFQTHRASEPAIVRDNSLFRLKENLTLTGLRGIPAVVTTGDAPGDTPGDIGTSPLSDVVFPSPLVGTDSSSHTHDSQPGSPQVEEKKLLTAGENGIDSKRATKNSPSVSEKKDWKKPKKGKRDNVLSRLSTFERYVSLMGPEEEEAEEASDKPVKRQISSFHEKTSDGVGRPQHASRLRLRGLEKRGRLSHVDSESNMSRLSDSSMHDYSMPRPTPYVRAPAYTTITDHIDRRESHHSPPDWGTFRSEDTPERETGRGVSFLGVNFPTSPRVTSSPNPAMSLKSSAKLEDEGLELEEMGAYSRINQLQRRPTLEDDETDEGGIVFTASASSDV